jgi:XRE family transcriptional regulator, regulator of sulfur utilization
MEELTRLRVEQGWSQQRLANESNVNKATINQIEKGRRSPNIETLEKLANALGVGVADFFPKAQASLWSGDSPAERRVATTWSDYVAERVEWCEQVMDKKEGDFNYPFASLDTAIQWAMYVGVESVTLRNVITHAEAEVSQDLRTLVERLVAVSERTDARVKVMMQQSALDAEEKEQVQVNLRLVHEQRSA